MYGYAGGHTPMDSVLSSEELYGYHGIDAVGDVVIDEMFGSDDDFGLDEDDFSFQFGAFWQSKSKRRANKAKRQKKKAEHKAMRARRRGWKKEKGYKDTVPFYSQIGRWAFQNKESRRRRDEWKAREAEQGYGFTEAVDDEEDSWVEEEEAFGLLFDAEDGYGHQGRRPVHRKIGANGDPRRSCTSRLSSEARLRGR